MVRKRIFVVVCADTDNKIVADYAATHVTIDHEGEAAKLILPSRNREFQCLESNSRQKKIGNRERFFPVPHLTISAQCAEDYAGT